MAAVCIAQGAPPSTIGNIDNPTAGQANLTFGGNLNLQPEKANTWTVGAVLTPRFLQGFNATIDYYNITGEGRDHHADAGRSDQRLLRTIRPSRWEPHLPGLHVHRA